MTRAEPIIGSAKYQLLSNTLYSVIIGLPKQSNKKLKSNIKLIIWSGLPHRQYNASKTAVYRRSLTTWDMLTRPK